MSVSDRAIDLNNSLEQIEGLTEYIISDLLNGDGRRTTDGYSRLIVMSELLQQLIDQAKVKFELLAHEQKILY